MADPDGPSSGRAETHDASAGVPPGAGAVPQKNTPGYDTAKRDYTGISAGALDSFADLRAARDFAEMIVDTVREGLLVLDFDLCVKAANESFYQTFDVQPEHTIGRFVYDLGNGQWDIAELRELLEDILPRNAVFNDFEVEHDFEGIGRRVMLLNARRLNDHRLILLAFEDVTEQRTGAEEQRRAAASLRRSEERFRSVSESGIVALAFFDTAGAITDANDAFLDLIGYTRAELEAGLVRWDQLTPPEWMPRTRAALEEYERTGRIEPYEKEYFRKGSERFWGLFGGQRLASTGEGVAFVLDISEQKRVEETLRENEERLRRAQKAASVGTWDLDLVTGAVFWSEGLFDLVGLPPEQGVPSTEAWYTLLHPDDRDRVEEDVRAAVASGGSYENEFRIVRPDGGVVWVAAKGHILRDETGRPARLLGANYDITERKRAEEALRRLNETLEERVEERTWQVRQYQRRVRELSRALALAEQQERRRIAHLLHDDLQQVLFGAKLALSLGKTEQLTEILNDAITLTRSLSHELSPPFLEGENVEDLLRWLADRNRERYGLEVGIEVLGDVPVPDTPLRVLLYQLLRELLFNVVKHAETNRARVVAELTDGHVRLVVEDEGAGFDPDRLAEAGPTGMGLPSVRERVELVGGRLDVASTPGRGTRVTLTLPSAEAMPVKIEPAAVPSKTSR
jgi:PAS domain S-box-containing protein